MNEWINIHTKWHFSIDWIGLDWIVVDNELTSCFVVCLLAVALISSPSTLSIRRRELRGVCRSIRTLLAVLWSTQCGHRYLTFALERASCQHSRLLHRCCRCSRHRGRHNVVDDQQPLGPDESVHPRGDEGECPRDRW